MLMFMLFLPQYQLDKATYTHSAGRFAAKVKTPTSSAPLNLAVSFYSSGSIRVKLSEEVPRWQPADILMDDGKHVTEYKELSEAEKRELTYIAALNHADAASYIALSFNTKAGTKPSLLVVHPAPLKVELYSAEGDLQVSLNERSLLHFEASTGSEQGAVHHDKAEETKDRHGGKEVIDYGEDGKRLCLLSHRTSLQLLVLPSRIAQCLSC